MKQYTQEQRPSLFPLKRNSFSLSFSLLREGRRYWKDTDYPSHLGTLANCKWKTWSRGIQAAKSMRATHSYMYHFWICPKLSHTHDLIANHWEVISAFYMWWNRMQRQHLAQHHRSGKLSSGKLKGESRTSI